ncbi:MAG: 4Fe-4S dicluster domain-containing protein [Proteobacteria bacterium]|nr:4Fe-4S dicluster domain-containing protein [Pseudomonadota bacterium]
MDTQLRERLAEALSLRGGAFPAVKCDEFYTLMEAIVTPEEAELAVRMPLPPSTREEVAQAAGMNADETEALLEGMADKGLVFVSEKNGLKRYHLLALLPGIFEFQFMKGEVSDHFRKLARLFDDYFKALQRMSRSDMPVPGVPFSRVIPIDREVKAEIEVFPFEQVSEYIANSDHITVSTCYCRHHGELLDNPCDKPKEVCFSFGPSAKFVSERGFGRPVSKDEALALMKTAEEAGLVHCSSNTSRYIDFVCNCCVCHCGILQSMKRSVSGAFGAHSNYIIDADPDTCTGCETCIDRCPMAALAMKDDRVEPDLERCIGCGVCVSTCPSGSLQLTARADRKSPPATPRDLAAAMIESLIS